MSEAALLGTTGKLTTAELEAILVTKKRNKDQAEALLINTGLITSETAEATATNVVTAAKLKELVQTKALTQAEADLIAAKAGVTLANQKESVSLLAGVGAKIKGAGTALKGLGTGILTIASAHPVIAGITAAIALCGGAAIVNKIKQEKAAKAIKEAYENAKTAIDDINNTFNENSSKTKEIAKEYAELAQGVNLLTNENKKLSTEKYERFLDLSNQLSSLYPSLTKQYDENGNAILDLSGSVDTIVGSLDDLIERQRTLANQEIVEQMPDLFKGYTNNVTDYEDKLEDAENTKEAIQSAYDEISKYGIYTAFDINGNATDENGDPVALKLGQYIDLLKKLGITAKQVNLKDSMGQIIGYKLELEDGSDIPNLSGIHDAYVSAFNQAQEDVKYAQQQLDAERSSINQYLNTWLQTEFSYNQIEDNGMQKAIQEMLFNFDWNSLPEGIDKNDWNAVSEYLRRNILFAINNVQDNPEISKAISEVFNNAELTPDEKANYIKQIQNYFGEDNVITLSLQPQLEETETLQKQYDDAVTKFGEESQDTLEKFFKDNSINDSSEIDYWNSVTEGAKSAEEAVNMYNEAKKNGDETDISFSDIFSLKDAENNLTDLGKINEEIDKFQSAYKGLKEAMDSYNETGTFTLDQVQEIISYGGDYLKYLMDENGNLQLNEEALNKVAIARINEMRAKALSNLMDNLDKITNEEQALSYLETQLLNTATAYDALTANRIKAWSENALENGISQETINKVTKSFKNQVSAINEMFNNISLDSIYKSSSSSASSATKDAEKATKDYIDSYMDYMEKSLESGRIDYQTYSRDVAKLLKDMYDQGKIAAKDYHDYTKEMLEVQKSAMDGVISAVTNRLDKEIDFYEDQIDVVEERYQTEIDYLDTVIEYYENQKKALQDTNDELDRQKALEEALYNFERAQNQKTQKVNYMPSYYSNVVCKK